MLPRVVVLVEDSRAWGRGLIAGVAKYSRLHGPWNFLRKPAFFVPHGRQSFLEEIREFKPDGIIMREVHDTREILRLGKPVVISPHKHPFFPGALNISENCEATGALGAQHLLRKGLRNFAYCGFDDMFWSRRRCEGFVGELVANGLEATVYEQPRRRSDQVWKNERPKLAKWLRSLPKPVGLMCCIDERSDQVVEICKAEGIHVPEEVALVGVDNDELICDLSSPPLSSIAFDAEGIGFEAAGYLHALMKGETLDFEKFVVEPAFVAERQSTEITAVDDADIASAISYIRNHAGRRVTVDDVAEAIATPRRSLERRFHQKLGNSIYREIQHERIARVERLLVETNMTVGEIAYSMGFANPNELTRCFCRCRGLSPTVFRRRHKQS